MSKCASIKKPEKWLIASLPSNQTTLNTAWDALTSTSENEPTRDRWMPLERCSHMTRKLGFISLFASGTLWPLITRWRLSVRRARILLVQETATLHLPVLMGRVWWLG